MVRRAHDAVIRIASSPCRRTRNPRCEPRCRPVLSWRYSCRRLMPRQRTERLSLRLSEVCIPERLSYEGSVALPKVLAGARWSPARTPPTTASSSIAIRCWRRKSRKNRTFMHPRFSPHAIAPIGNETGSAYLGRKYGMVSTMTGPRPSLRQFMVVSAGDAASAATSSAAARSGGSGRSDGLGLREQGR